MERIRLFEAFAGYGSQSMALERLRRDGLVDYEVVGYSEIDKYAITAYNAVHPNITNYGDITKINWNDVPDFDLLTWSSPCQDISNAGKQKGLVKDSGTRSSLIWCVLDAIRIKKPKYILMENVKALVSDKFLPDLQNLLAVLEDYGYDSVWQVLDSKDYGIPQHRESICMGIPLRSQHGIQVQVSKGFQEGEKPA